MLQVIGKVSATEKMPSTIDNFYFWTDKGQILSPFDIVKVEHVSSNSDKSITYGVIEEITHVTDAASHFTNFISSNFGDTADSIGQMNRLGMNYVKAKVVCNTDDIYTPVLDGKQVSLCDEEDIRTALGLNDVKNPLVCGYLEMYQGNAAKKVKVELNSHFLIGPDGAHLNISGISGLAAKTSYSMFLLNAIQHKFKDIDGSSVAFVFFNVKGRDLMAIDETNTELPEKDKKIYADLGLSIEPFKNVRYYYPYTKDEIMQHAQSYAHPQDVERQKKNHKAFTYKFTYDKSQDKLDLLLANEDDSTGTLESCVNYVINGEGYFAGVNNWKKNWEADPEWDRVFVTTLFTFHWRITIDTINFAKKLVKDTKNLMVGGVLATIQAKEVYEATGIKPFKGILNIPGQLDKRNQLIIDNLPLDYSILDEIEYKYPMNNAYYGYTTRGCIRKCPFCAVPKLEPVYNSYIPLRERIEETRKQYGDQKDLLLMDNNILASSEFDTIINDIVACGFGKDAIFIQPDLLALSIAHLRSTPVINERANIRKAQSLIMEFYQKLKGEESFEIYKIIFEKYKINKLLTTTKEHLLAAYDEIKDIYKKHFKPAPRHRYVDFNQGVDARLFTEENVKQLSRIAIRPLRIAFDNIKTEAQYTRAIEMSSKVGLKDFSNYLLYNFDDHPDDLYHRLRINVELCDRLNVSIYSFPMKYHPIRRTEDMDEDYSHNRDYIGKYWNRKYIRAIQAVLNSTKGKIGKGTSFFMKAFGENIEEYHKLLEMPETMIIYRYFFEWLGLENGGKKTAIEILGNDSICNASAHSWWKAFCTCKENVSSKEWEMALNIIHKNDFSKSYHTGNSYVDTLLGYYVSYRQAIIEPNTDLYKLKQVYDQNPLKELRRTQKIK